MLYSRITSALSSMAGHPLSLILAMALIMLWGVSGPFLHFSDAWQLTINTSTTIITFLMVFIIQSSQNRDTRALQIKLDELIKNTSGARDALLDLEDRSEKELIQIQAEYNHLAKKAADEKKERRAARTKVRRGTKVNA